MKLLFFIFGIATFATLPVWADQQHFPISPYDFVNVEQVRSAARLDRRLKLSNSANQCLNLHKAKKLEADDWLASYLRCRTTTQVAQRNIVRVSEEREILNTFDTFRAIDLVIELPIHLKKGRIQLPSKDVNLFFSSCRHSWVSQTGCYVGTNATGYLDYEPFDANSGLLHIVLAFRSDEYLYEGVSERKFNKQPNLAFAVRVAIGKDPFNP